MLVMTDEGMQPSVVACLATGIFILFALIVLLILWFIRFRHIWRRRSSGSTYLPNSPATSTPPQEVHSNAYTTDLGAFRTTSEPIWNTTAETATSYEPSKVYSYPQYYPDIAAKNAVGQTSTAEGVDGVWPCQQEKDREETIRAEVVPTQMRAVSGVMVARETGTREVFPQSVINAQFDASKDLDLKPVSSVDLSSVTAASIDRKPIKRNVRSRMAAAARVSQFSVFATRPRDSVRVNARKRRHLGGPKKVHAMQSSSDDQYNCLSTLDDGYYNSNVIVENDTDELESLDNDTFLHSIEQVIFLHPPMQSSDILTSSSSQGSFIPSLHSFSKTGATTQDIPRTTKLPPNVIVTTPLDDLGSLVSGDLGLGPNIASSISNAFMSSLTDQSDRLFSRRRATPTFQFPQPGPPVAGWANQFSRQPPVSILDVRRPPVFSDQPPKISSNVAMDQLPLKDLVPPSPIPHLQSSNNVPKTAATLQMDLWSTNGTNLQPTVDHTTTENFQQHMNELRRRSFGSSVGCGSASTLASIVGPLPELCSPSPVPGAFLQQTSDDSGFQSSFMETSLELDNPSIQSNRNSFLFGASSLHRYSASNLEINSRHSTSPNIFVSEKAGGRLRSLDVIANNHVHRNVNGLNTVAVLLKKKEPVTYSCFERKPTNSSSESSSSSRANSGDSTTAILHFRSKNVNEQRSIHGRSPSIPNLALSRSDDHISLKNSD